MAKIITDKTKGVKGHVLKVKEFHKGSGRQVYIRALRKPVTMEAILANPVTYLKRYDLSWMFDNTKEELDAIKKLNAHKVAKGTIKITIE